MGEVRTAEDNLVRPGLQEWLDLRAHRPFDAVTERASQRLFRRAALPFLNQPHELVGDNRQHRHARRETRLRLIVEPSVERPRRRENADDARLRAKRGGLEGRLDADERDGGKLRAQMVNGRRRRRVAGDDDHIAAAPQQRFGVCNREPHDLFGRPVAIRAIRRVGQILRRHVRAQPPKRREDARAANATVKKANLRHNGDAIIPQFGRAQEPASANERRQSSFATDVAQLADGAVGVVTEAVVAMDLEKALDQ